MTEAYHRATCGDNVLHGWLLPRHPHDRHRYLQVDGARQTVYLASEWQVEECERPARLIEQDREHADQLDRDAASAMNAANLADHLDWGGGLQLHAPPIQHVVVRRACGCANGEHCSECLGRTA